MKNNFVFSKGYIENSYDKDFPANKDKATDCVEDSGVLDHATLRADAPAGLIRVYNILGAHKHLGIRKIQTYNNANIKISVIPL